MLRKKFKLSSKLIACVLISGILAGCAGTNSGADSKKDTVTMASGYEATRFFSAGPDGSNNNDLPVLNNIYDPLVYVKPDGSLEPALAESWSVSEDGKVYTFKIRQDVKFHDGSVLTAEDVAYSFDIAIQNSVGKALLINYDYSEVVDDTTVNVYLTDPYAPFIKGVASRAGYIFSKKHHETVGVEGYLKEPIGTGAYKFISAVSGDTVTLEAFEDYWNGAPKIKTVYIKTMSDASTQVIALENGDVDVLLSPSISSCINMNTDAGVSWDTADSAGRVTLHISTNEGTPGIDDNFRKAVQYAINKADVIEGATEGYATQIDIDMCENYSAYPDNFDVIEKDVEKAKEYLSKSSYNNEPFEILVQVGTTYDTAAQIIQAQLINVGINCTIQAVDAATFTDIWYAGAYDGMIRNTTSSLMDADGFLNFFMATDYAPTNNNQHPRTKEIYELGLEARVVKEDQRKELYAEMVNIVTEEAYEVPLFANTNVMAYRTDLKGIEIHPLTYVKFADWSFE